MNVARVLFAGGLIAALPAQAIYAPLPEQDQRKDWSVTLRAGVSHDSNIFGAKTGAIASTVYEFSPSFAFNGAISDRTVAAFGYTLTLDHFDNRPGEKTLDSHEIFARGAHAFGPEASIDLSDSYQIIKNPESLLAGLPLNTDQSFKRNEFDARFTENPLPKLGATLKFRSIAYDYDNAALATSLNRTENLYGLAGSYAVLPELSAVAEYRHEDIGYRTAGNIKDKKSDFLIGGMDYALAKKFRLVGRIGNDWRTRSAERDSSGAYVEVSAKYDYAQRSLLTFGYVYTFEETSDVAIYNDTRVNRMFVNVQHAITALVVASASLTYEPSQLQGRRGHPNADETTTRAGAALTWLPTPHWSFSASVDHDNVDSEDPSRSQKRDRYGVSAGFTF